ncbi:MAG TPA: PBP1A family penicillin-binding protein, partial [Candidatus Merdenecus merdavium]|nr:PBP1A family penicillin-binding protein [Candidatus Merdenecus merdavium]
MNFGKKETSKKQKNIQSKSEKFSKKAGVTFMKAACFLLLACIVIGTCIGIGAIRGIISNAPDISKMNISTKDEASFIYDAKGNEVQKLSAPQANRINASLDEIPINMQHAVVAIEDERFYEHKGIDIRGIFRAFYVNISRGNLSEGASTITQQLLKNNLFTNWVSESSYIEKFERKFQEQYLALELEKITSKDQILTEYLNAINLGAGTYGVKAAARKYFGKDISDLTLSECTVIAGITQNPTQYNPIDHPDKNQARREQVLNKMLEQGYITQSEYDEALQDNVYERIQSNNFDSTEDNYYSYFSDELIKQVKEDLVEELGYTPTQALKALYSGGLQIISTQDSSIQTICDEEFSNPENFPSVTEWEPDFALSVQKADGSTVHYSKEMMKSYFQETEEVNFNLIFSSPEEASEYVERYKDAIIEEGDTIIQERINYIPQPQASLFLMDQHTGYVRALVGGRGEKKGSLVLNRATESAKQPGSVFKIISTYAPALDSAGKSLATVYDNAPFKYNNGSPVYNWEGKTTYTGLTTIRTAIANSTNIVAVKTLDDINVQLGWEYVQNFGFTTVSKEDAIQPLALGGIKQGVYNSELTASFAAIANNGTYIEPIYYTKILNSDGEVLIDKTKDVKTTRVIKESTAFLLTNAMQDVVSAGGTGSDIQAGNMPVAGKTGTTSNYNDIWFSGYTPYFTCSVWAGYDSSKTLPDGDKYHKYNKILWTKVMTRVHEELPVVNFDDAPSDIVKREVCKKSGKLALKGVCDHDERGNMVYTEYFQKGSEPKDYCDVHVSAKIC